MAIKRGTTFHSVYADGNCKWKVLKSLGRGVWLCEIDANEPDYGGAQKSFLAREIECALHWESFCTGNANEHDKFYSALKPGQIIHYNNGFNNYVRCEVVVVDGENKLKPIALVGNWKEYDLPHRQRDGSIYPSYYPKMIAEGKVFTPNVSNLFEYKWLTNKTGVDPRTLTPLDLSVPELSPAAKVLARKWALLDQIGNIARDAHESEVPDEALAKIKYLCTGVIQ